MGYLKKLALLFALLAMFLPQAARAENRADIMMVPTRLVMKDSDRYAQVIVKNVGTATGDLRLDIIDMTMLEDGNVVPLEEGKSDPYSAKSFLRVAPHSMTLKAGETQYVRILLRKPESLAPGEYRSHMAITVVNDNVEGTTENKSDAAADGKDASGDKMQFAVKVRIVMSIPVIVRRGDLTLSMKIEQPKITRDPNGKPVASLTLVREGNRSVMGDFTFTHTPPGGQPKVIKFYPGIATYRSVDRRTVSIPLDDLPEGTDLTKGTLDISYNGQESEGKKKFAEARMELGPY